MKTQITCRGKVVSLVRDGAVVMTRGPEDVCAGCAASAMCKTGGSLLVAGGCLAASVNIGDEVEVGVDENLRWRSICLCLVMPCLALLGGFGVAEACGAADEVAAAAALLAVAAYFGLLFIVRGRLTGKRWTIIRIC